MLNRIFPKQIDNRYRGHWLGRADRAGGADAAGAGRGLDGRPALHRAAADAIPLDSYGPAGPAAAVSLFALLGLSISLLLLWGVVVLIRYRAMIPLLYLIVLLQIVGTKVLVTLHPIARAGTAELADRLADRVGDPGGDRHRLSAVADGHQREGDRR